MYSLTISPSRQNCSSLKQSAGLREAALSKDRFLSLTFFFSADIATSHPYFSQISFKHLRFSQWCTASCLYTHSIVCTKYPLNVRSSHREKCKIINMTAASRVIKQHEVSNSAMSYSTRSHVFAKNLFSLHLGSGLAPTFIAFWKSLLLYRS